VPDDRLVDWYRAVLALPNKVIRDYLLLLLFTGMRRREAAALRWDEVDFGLGVIRIPAERTKSHRTLVLPMTNIVRGLLVARLEVGRDSSGFVFPGNSRSGHLEEPQAALLSIERATGIRVIVHDLRRTYITVAESTDISPLALKALVNHSMDDDVTSRHYVRLTVERLRGPAQRVADRLKELCGIGIASPGLTEAPEPAAVAE